ncbi:MAG TPA: hypothetical protein ENK18_19085 [Deltaproteobacteria bacterium]|nr:hypothetical protein [Deltaproteobacteria bacterium]
MCAHPMLLLIVWGGCGPQPEPTEPTGSSEPRISNLSWRLHPDLAPFAYVSWDQQITGEVTVEVSVDEGEWLSLPPTAAQIGRNEQLVVGLPYGAAAAYRIRDGAEVEEAADRIVLPGAPGKMPLGTLKVSEADAWLQEGRYLLTSVSQTSGGWGTNGPFWTLILDRRGRPVWGRVTEPNVWTLYAQVSTTGDHILIDEISWLGGDPDRIFRSYLDGVFEEIEAPGLHHAFVELPDGTLTWASQAHAETGEALVEKAPGQDDETVLWSCIDDWPQGNAGWACSSNCVYYSAERDSYLYSFYSNETVVEIDRASGSTLWWAGGVDGGYRFEPLDSRFYWQHGVSYTPAGTLLLSTQDQPIPETNLAREYVVDHDTQTLTEVWSYDAGVLADTNGDTWRLPNGNTLHTLGSAAQLKEIDPDGQTVWHLDFGGTRLMGRSQWLTDLYPLLSPELHPQRRGPPRP